MNCRLTRMTLTQFSCRHRNIRSGVTRSFANIYFNKIWIVQLFCAQSTAQDGYCSPQTGRACECRTVYHVPRQTSVYCRSVRDVPGQLEHLHATLLRPWRRAVHPSPTSAEIHARRSPILPRYHRPRSPIPPFIQHHLPRPQTRKPVTGLSRIPSFDRFRFR